MAKKQNRKVNPAPDPADVTEEKPGLETGGQAGDTQGLSDVAEADSESVAELAEEGQFFEAAVVSGVENAPDADVAEVTTHEVPEDDVPPEYLDQDLDEPKE
jgi:N utilization substance protein A